MIKRIATALALLVLAVTASAAEFHVIAHSSVSATPMTKSAASAIFLKRTAKWDDGTPIVVVDQIDNGVRQAFSNVIHGRSVAAIKSYWQQQIFSGRDIPPVEKTSDEEVLAFVRSKPGAIGYVSDKASTNGVVVIQIQ